MKDRGQVAFEAYCDAQGIGGKWAFQSAAERRAWAAVEQACARLPMSTGLGHDWHLEQQEYDDTFFRCTRVGCGEKTNCRRGYPDPHHKGPCRGQPPEGA